MTGAASGIGLATATRFAEEGMQVVMADIQDDALDAEVFALRRAGYEITGVHTDVSRYEQIEKQAARAIDASGKVNVVHNNAGVVRAGTLEEPSLEDWQWVLGVPLIGWRHLPVANCC